MNNNGIRGGMAGLVGLSAAVAVASTAVAAGAAGRTFGAHLHNAACATDQPLLSGGHYNHDAHSGAPQVVVSDDTEVWLDFTVDAAGAGDSSSAVQFTPTPGARSVVIHADPTNPATGGAGRLACLPVEW